MKYTLYAWCADNEGGIAICNFGEFSPNRDYYPESGWRAQPSTKIGDFSTVSELADLLYKDNNGWYANKSEALKDATEMMERYNELEAEEDWW